MVRGRAPAKPPAPVRAFLMGADEWLDLPAWPPPDSRERALYLDSGGRANSRFGDGRLVDSPPPAGSPSDQWLHDPDRPVPFITPASSNQIGGPDDYSGVETRGDVLVYTSEPLEQALDVIGPVRLVAHIATSAADTDLHSRLLDVYPGGFAQRLCDGVVRLRYREGHERQLPAEPGAVYEVEVVMWDTAQRFAPGHRIRLEIASSAYPAFATNLGTGADETLAIEGVIVENVLYHDAARASRLLLTVM
jgi:putative CocE/NonD family hydrolase